MFKKIIATFCTLVFSAMLTGCGTKAGNDISSDISSMMPDTNNSSQQNDNYSSQQNDSYSSQQGDDYSAQQNGNASEAKISKEEAKKIALDHANVKESEISDYEIELDNENGVLIYDISFDHNGKEYDYDVNAQTGKITNSKNELID